MSVEALARVLLNYRRTITDTDQVKAIDLHQAQQMLRDPAPLLAALAEAGVLRVEWNVAGVDNEGCEWTAGLQEDKPPPLSTWMKRDNGHHERRYTTDWTEVQR